MSSQPQPFSARPDEAWPTAPATRIGSLLEVAWIVLLILPAATTASVSRIFDANENTLFIVSCWLIVAARLNSATPSAGLSFELDVIAACFIGGASASGGVGKVMGVVIGAFVMGVMNNGMSIYGLGIYWQMVVKGVVLLSAVYVDVYQKSKG